MAKRKKIHLNPLARLHMETTRKLTKARIQARKTSSKAMDQATRWEVIENVRHGTMSIGEFKSFRKYFTNHEREVIEQAIMDSWRMKNSWPRRFRTK